MKNLLNLNGLYDSSPNQTGETQSRQNRTVVKPWSSRGQAVLTLLLFFLTLGVGQAWGANKRIYCKCAQSWWKNDGAAVAAHYWGGTNATSWPGTRMTALAGETDVWYIDIPDDNNNVIFVRVNGSGDIKDWGAKTGDLTISTDKNLYTITSSSAVWGDPGCSGSWSAKQYTSTGSLSASTTSTAVGAEVTLTPSLTSNTAYNTIKSTAYSVTANPGSAGSVTSGGVFSATAAGTYTVTATITYNVIGFTGITKTVSPTVTITVADVHALTVNKDAGITSVTGGVVGINTSTDYPITATVKTGYSFDGWTTNDGSIITITNPKSASTASVRFKSDNNAAVTATSTENMTTVTLAASPAGAGTFTIGGAAATKTTAGKTTTRSITAVPGNGYYVNTGSTVWSKNNSYITLSSTTTNPTTVTGGGTAGTSSTLTATFSPIWYFKGTFNSWGTTTPFVFTSATSGYVDVDLSTNTDFKLYNAQSDKWYGSEYGIEKGVRLSTTLWDNNNNDCPIDITGLTGTWRFTIDVSGTYPVLTATPPVYNQVRISAATPANAANVGNFDMSAAVSNVRTVTRSLAANTTYTFKVVYNSDWYGYNSGTFTRNSSTSSNLRTVSTDGGDMTLKTDYAGDYTFNFNQSTKALSVTYPTAYKVTFSKGTVNGSTGSCSAVDLDNSNATVTSNSTWVKSGHKVKLTAPAAKTGYTFDGWFNNNSGTGEAITTNANCTITVSSEETYYACYHENLTAVTITTDGHGTITTPNPNESPYNLGVATTQAINASPNTGYHWNTWTVSGNADLVSAAATQSNTAKGNGTAGGTGTVTATFTPNTYRVQFHRNGAPEATVYQDFTYDAAQNLTANSYTRTGYTFAGWALSTDGAVKYANGEEVSNLTSENGATFHLYAKWTPNNYTVMLDKQTGVTGYGGNAGTVTNQTVTFDATLSAVSGSMPTAADGYAFMGFYSEEGGNGRCFINSSGAWVTEAGDTISGGHWVKPEGITLFAYYKKAEITALTFDAAVVAPGGSVGVTPTVAPTPTGTNSICWKLLYSNGNLYSPQPTFSPTAISNKVTFNAPSTSGTYLIAAVLRTGDDCNGTKLDSVTSSFQVAGDHNVTVQYKCGNTTIAASTTTTGRPLVWSSAIAAPDIFGYTFHHWLAGDGITLSEDGENAKTGVRADSSVVSPIYIKAIYDGKLTAVYTQNNIIYFKNTLGWSGDDIHVYFYKSSGYWDTSNGAGATGDACIGKGKMDIVPGETDIYYWDYSGITGGTASATKHVAFTNKNEMSQDHFWDCEVVYPTKGNNEGFSTGTPMFVPISQTPVGYNNYSGKQADYYNKGYWTKYAGGTGYSIDIFFSKGGSHDKSINFEEGETAGMPFTATAYLSGGTILGFKIHRSSGLYYYSSTDVTMSNASTAKSLTYDNTSSNKQTGITTNVTGEYTFTLTCGSDGKLNVTVKYPAAAGDYRLVYSDGVQTKPLVSDVVPQVNGGKDTVSFFVRPGSTPLLKIQQASESAGVLSWGDYSDISSSVSGLAATGVYNICLTMNESGAISVENVEAYTGNFYIRTDAANNKWDNYRAADHLMTYSEYSETYSDYTHYFMAYVANGKNVKFVVANDYSPCISDTLVQSTFRDGDSYHVDGSGNIKADANVRFMWNRSNNAVYRAYLAKAQSNGSKFLVLRANSSTDLMDENGNALTGVSEGTPGNNHGGGLNCMQFTDNQNWIYEANVKVRPGAYVKLYAHFHDKDFYYRGKDNNTFDAPNAIQLITGEGDAVKVRVVYDFKTDRLLAAWMPEGEINNTKAINADVMFVREGQGDILQLTFTESGEITNIKTAYGVMRFNKWTLNNKSKEGGHAVLSDPKSVYERSLFWISFPFKVKLSEVFGFGTYGVDWAIQKYNGARRAAEGFWAESRGFWEWMDRNTEYLDPDQGYLLAIDLDRLGSDASVWNNNVENVELYFPSYGTMPSITSANVEHTLPSHECKIDWSKDKNGDPTDLLDTGNASTSYNRTVFDSHWNVMSVPTYVNTSNIAFANTDWITAGKGKHGPNFLYTWNPDDNTLTPTAGAGYHYHAMHAYMVQYHGDVTWSASSGSPYSSIVARRTYADQPEKLNLCLEIRQNEKMIDRTYVVLSNDEEVSENFQFGEDMTKEFNARKANICTYVEGMTVAGNTMPMSEQTTIVPVGAYIKSAGDYTFAIPEGTNGVGVTLIDNETGVRTSLSALDYTVYLEPGTYDSRFLLEISPVQNTPADLGNVQGDNEGTKVRKVMIDGILYIVKDGKMFDARGTLVR